MIRVRGRVLWLLGLAWLVAGLGCADAADGEGKPEKAKTVVIPLDQIAGLGRGGLRALEPELQIYRDTPENIKKYSDPVVLEDTLRKLEQQSLVIPIERAMSELPIGKEIKPRAGFAVRGRDRAALTGVYRVLVQGKKPNKSFPADEEVSVVFFTAPAGFGVCLDCVVRRGNSIEIRYMLIPRGLLSVHSTLRLVPCGKLPSGEYQVKIIRSVSRENEFIRHGFPAVESVWENLIVCNPFRFTVSDQSSEDSNTEIQLRYPE